MSDTPGGMALALSWTLNLSRLSILDIISTIWRNLWACGEPRYCPANISFWERKSITVFSVGLFRNYKTIPTAQVGIGFIGVLNESGIDEGISFLNAAIIGENSREKTLKFTILESQRALAIRISNTPGGDGTPFLIRGRFGSGTDMAGNDIVPFTANITQFDDVVLPEVQSSILNLTDGKLIIITTETIDTTLIDTSKFQLQNVSGESDVYLTGATVDAEDGVNITLTLTEAQRVRAIEISATPGDNEAVLEIGAGGVTDYARKKSCELRESPFKNFLILKHQQ